MSRWLDVVIDALKHHHGEAKLSQIYEWVKEHESEPWTRVSDPRSRIRATLYEFSSDSDYFDGNKEDIFYAVNGKGRGVWGLRSINQEWNGNFWWVCQGKTYKDARDSGWIFAPEKGFDGSVREHWRRVGDVRKGDLILHWSSSIMAIGLAVDDANLGARPHSTNSDDLLVISSQIYSFHNHKCLQNDGTKPSPLISILHAIMSTVGFLK